MLIKEYTVDELILDPDNARTHNQANIDVIKASLSRFGQRKNIVIDQNRIVIAGNGTLIAAKQLGWKTIQADMVELSALDKTAYALIDNRAAELADWDDDILKGQLAALQIDGFNIDELGFGDFNFEDLNIEGEDDVNIEPDCEFSAEISGKDNYFIVLCRDSDEFKALYEKMNLEPVKMNLSKKETSPMWVQGKARLVTVEKMAAVYA